MNGRRMINKSAVITVQRMASFLKLSLDVVLRLMLSSSEFRQSGARTITRKPMRASGPYCVRILRTKQCGSEMVSGAEAVLY